MSDIFQSGFDNIGARAVAEAQARADKYNQELTKREMLSQTEESLGGVKLFTSGRQIGENIVKNSKLKPYIKQQVKKLLKKKAMMFQKKMKHKRKESQNFRKHLSN